MLLDIGSVGNVTGDLWARDMARKPCEAKRTPEQYKRDRPLNVSGVGNGSQTCTHNVKLPIAIPGREKHLHGTFDSPSVPESSLPGLLGLTTLRKVRGIIDCNTCKLYLAGPADYNLLDGLPPGTEEIQCEFAPSGHMVMPCAEFEKLDKEPKGGVKSEPISLPVATTSQ